MFHPLLSNIGYNLKTTTKYVTKEYRVLHFSSQLLLRNQNGDSALTLGLLQKPEDFTTVLFLLNLIS